MPELSWYRVYSVSAVRATGTVDGTLVGLGRSVPVPVTGILPILVQAQAMT